MKLAALVGRTGSVFALWGSVFAMSACSDANGRTDEFRDRVNQINASKAVEDEDAGVVDAGPCTLPKPEELSGEYLFTLSTNVGPSRPFLFDGTLSAVDEGGKLMMSIALKTLTAADRKTPTGETLQAGPVEVNPDGSFVIDFGNVSLSGASNPISGSPLLTTVVAQGRPGTACSPIKIICGSVTGNATKPYTIDLKGSTFTFEKLSDPSVYPSPPVINCKGEKAAAL